MERACGACLVGGMMGYSTYVFRAWTGAGVLYCGLDQLVMQLIIHGPVALKSAIPTPRLLIRRVCCITSRSKSRYLQVSCASGSCNIISAD